MSAGAGPKIFALTRSDLEAMTKECLDSVDLCVEQVQAEVASEDEPNMKASLERWLARFQQMRRDIAFMVDHLAPEAEHRMTGTELVAIRQTFSPIRVNAPRLRLMPPPEEGQVAERRLANIAAAVPRTALPEAALGSRG